MATPSTPATKQQNATPNNALASAPTNAIAAPSDAQTLQARSMAKRLKYMIVNGNKLSDAEAYALAWYSTCNGLNPFAQECWYLPGIGPCPGIAGWRKKAQEQLEYEARSAGMGSANYWIDIRDALPSESTADPSRGDIAYHITLHDWISNSRWRHGYFETIKEAQSAGYTFEEARTIAQQMVGPEPVVTAVGVVRADESFGKSEKFDRHERAQKRAEKLALRKRFPRLDAIMQISAEDVDQDVVDAAFADVEDVEDGKPPRQINEILSDLGFDPETHKTTTTQRPYTPEALKTYLVDLSSHLTDDLAPEDTNKVAACLDYILAGKGKRLEFLAWLVDKPVTSLHDLQPSMIQALNIYIDPEYDKQAAVFKPHDAIVCKEVPAAHAAGLVAAGQGTLFN